VVHDRLESENFVVEAGGQGRDWQVRSGMIRSVLTHLLYALAAAIGPGMGRPLHAGGLLVLPMPEAQGPARAGLHAAPR
jgi:hypothetical protein